MSRSSRAPEPELVSRREVPSCFRPAPRLLLPDRSNRSPCLVDLPPTTTRDRLLSFMSSEFLREADTNIKVTSCILFLDARAAGGGPGGQVVWPRPDELRPDRRPDGFFWTGLFLLTPLRPQSTPRHLERGATQRLKGEEPEANNAPPGREHNHDNTDENEVFVFTYLLSCRLPEVVRHVGV